MKNFPVDNELTHCPLGNLNEILDTEARWRMYVIANLASSNSSNVLHQTINCTNAYLLSFGQLETLETHDKMMKEIILKIPSAKCLPFAEGFNVVLHEVGMKYDFREVALHQVSMTLGSSNWISGHQFSTKLCICHKSAHFLAMKFLFATTLCYDHV